VVADQRNFSAKASIADLAPKWRTTTGDCLETRQTHGGSIEMVHATLHKDLKLSKKSTR
jgi:hypothetical protein